MAAAAGFQFLDPSKGARIPLRIGEALLQDQPSPRKRQRVSVQYNHWPKSATAGKAVITHKSNKSFTLDVKSGSTTTTTSTGSFEYEGAQHARQSGSVALFYNAADKSFTLDKVEAGFLFNLRSTPSQPNDPAALKARYPQLDLNEQSGKGVDNGDEIDSQGLFDDNDNSNEDAEEDDAAPDASNPYDYRHFLQQQQSSHTGDGMTLGERSPSPAAYTASSPIASQRDPRQHTSTKSPTSQRPKHTAAAAAPLRTAKPKPKQIKRSTQYLSPVLPSRDNIDDEGDQDQDGRAPLEEPDELVIDMGDDAPSRNGGGGGVSGAKPRPWRSALGSLNGGGGGPISLRSAASSMSPSIRGLSDNDNDDDGEEEAEKEDNYDDDDVEGIDLGNGGVGGDAGGAATAGNTQSPDREEEQAATPGGNGWDDMGDELEAEFKQALDNIDDQDETAQQQQQQNVVPAGANNRAVNESSSESEEE